MIGGICPSKHLSVVFLLSWTMASSFPTNAPEDSFPLMINDIDGPHEIYLVILNSGKDHIVARVESGVLSVPITRPSNELFAMWQNETEKVERYLENEYGVPLRILRLFFSAEDHDAKRGVGQRDMLVLELFDNHIALSNNLRWVHRHQIPKYTWEQTHKIMIDRRFKHFMRELFKDINNEPSEFQQNIAVWRRQGWIEHITSWVRDALKHKSFTLWSPIRACAHSFPSVVLKCEARRPCTRDMASSGEREMLYIKAALPQFNEVARTETIARVVGPIVPEVIAFDAEQGVMIMRDAGHVEFDAVVEEYVVNTIKLVQTKSMDHLDELKEGGLEVRDSKWLSSNIESILNHPVVDRVHRWDDTKENLEYLRSRVPLIQELCDKMNEWKLPNVLVHGDAHSDNYGSLLSGEEKVYRLFDWANAFIGPPMLDAYMMDFEGRRKVGRNEEQRPSLKQFGKLWESFVPPSDLPIAIERVGILSLAIGIYNSSRAYEIATAPYFTEIENQIANRIDWLSERVRKHDDTLR